MVEHRSAATQVAALRIMARGVGAAEVFDTADGASAVRLRVTASAHGTPVKRGAGAHTLAVRCHGDGTAYETDAQFLELIELEQVFGLSLGITA